VNARKIGAALAASTLMAVAAPSALAAPQEHARPQPRLVVADGSDGSVRVYDARRGGRALRQLRVAGPAALTVVEGGRYVIATQGVQNRVDAIDAGAWSEAHGDHHHHHTQPPKLLPFRLSVPKPVHVVPHDDEVAIFADGDGTARVFRLAALTRRAGAPLATLPSGKPHHGVAVPMGERFILSKADPAAADGSLPPRLDVVDRGGAVLSSVACPEMHGEVSRGDWAAFACEDGISLLTPGSAGATPRSEKLAYPAGATAERRAFTLHADADGRRLVGGFGDRELVVVHLASMQARTIAVGGVVASFAVDAGSGAILALTTDGMLRRLDPATGRQTASRRVVGRPFTPSWSRPSPKLAVAGGLAAVSDHRRDRVTVLRTGRLRVVQALTVRGAPTGVALAGTLH
jgi:hypothetical protein